MNAEMKKQRDLIVSMYRTKRATPRFEATDKREAYGFEDPAPPWVPALVDAIFEHASGDALVRATVATALASWCASGDPVARAEQVITILLAWPGDRLEMLSSFIASARATKSGKRAGSKRRPARAVMIPDAWPEESTAPSPPIVVPVPRDYWKNRELRLLARS